jgi:hypothetical protein
MYEIPIGTVDKLPAFAAQVNKTNPKQRGILAVKMPSNFTVAPITELFQAHGRNTKLSARMTNEIPRHTSKKLTGHCMISPPGGIRRRCA